MELLHLGEEEEESESSVKSGMSLSRWSGWARALASGVEMPASKQLTKRHTGVGDMACVGFVCLFVGIQVAAIRKPSIDKMRKSMRSLIVHHLNEVLFIMNENVPLGQPQQEQKLVICCCFCLKMGIQGTTPVKIAQFNYGNVTRPSPV